MASFKRPAFDYKPSFIDLFSYFIMGCFVFLRIDIEGDSAAMAFR